MKNKNRALLRNRIFYGLGEVGPTIFDTFIGSFLTLYATDVLGLNALYFASVLLAPKIVDVVIDLFIMYFVGKTRTRFGMYRPWLLNMAAMVVALVTIFSVPFFQVSGSAILVIVVVAYFICNAICDSCYWIPYTAMPGVMTEDGNELVKISSTKTIFDYVFSVLVAASTMPILLAFGSAEGDYRNPKGWLVVALIFGLVSLISSLLCFFFVRTDADLEKKMTQDYSARDIVMDYKHIIGNKSFLAVSAIMFLTYLATYINQTVSYYFYIYNLNIESIIGYLSLIGAAVAVLVSLLTGKLQKRFGFKGTLLIGAVSLIASAILMTVTYNAVMMIVTGCFLVTGTTILMILVYSLWPVVARNLNEQKVKAPLNSTVGLSNIFSNLAIILSDTVGAAIITFSKYNPELSTQDGFTLRMFRYASPAIMIVLSVIMIIIVFAAFRTNRDGGEHTII